jgi:hypothetical protein
METVWSQDSRSGEPNSLDGESGRAASSTGCYLGVDLVDVDSDLARKLSVSSRTGAVVSRVHPRSPAADQGMEPGDVILELGGQPIPKASVLENILRACVPGKRYVVELVRGQAYMSMLVTMKAAPEKTIAKVGAPQEQGSHMNSESAEERSTGSVGQPPVRITTVEAVLPAIGMRVTSAGTDEAHDLGIETPIGAVITAVQLDSPGAEAGLQRGDLITHVAGREIICYEDFEAQLFGEKPGQRLAVRIVRGDKPFTTEIALGRRDGQIQLFTHPTGAYQLRLPVSWSDLTSGQSAEHGIDRFQSWEKHYVLECLPVTRPAPHAEEALDAFMGRCLRQGWTNAQQVRLGDDRVSFVSREQAGDPRRLVYLIGLVRKEMLCELQLSAPIVSDSETLPVIVPQLLTPP